MPTEVSGNLRAAGVLGVVGAAALLLTPDVNYLGTLIAFGGIGLLLCSAGLLLAALIAWAAAGWRSRRDQQSGRGPRPRG